MDNIVSYIRAQQHTFSEVPFNAVDSLVLSTACYFDLGAIEFADPYGAERVLLHDMLALCDRQRMTQKNWMRDSTGTEGYWDALMASRRYRDVTFGFYVNEVSDVVEKQFSAVCFFLPNEVAYLAFRGTDGSFAGWKEDFNLVYKKVIPSQAAAVRYVSGIASAITEPLMVGGHSKGGHLAEYAALVVDESIYERIMKVYNHDGPFFLEEPSPRIATASYEGKLHKTVPESSAFGMLLEERSSYHVVRSTAKMIFQHEPFTWIVDGDDFLYQDHLNKNAVFLDSSVDAWLKSRTPEERERLVDSVYELFAATDVEDWYEFNDKFISNIRSVISSSSKLDDETKKLIIKTIAALASSVRNEAVKRMRTESPVAKARKESPGKQQD